MESQALDYTAVEVNKDDVKYRLKIDREFFIQFFMYEYLTVPIPDLHIEIFNLMVDNALKRVAIAIPRGHAKTTIAKLACVYLFLFSPYSFIVYVSNTSEIAVDAVSDIVSFLESPNFAAVFGEIEWRIRQEGKGYYRFRIGNKDCILRARGANQQMRGINVEHRRPQVAIVDDLEDIDNTATETLLDQLISWFFRTFIKAMDQFDNRVIQIGNMVARKCILRMNIDSPNWTSVLLGVLTSEGKPLWPDLWPIEKLRVDFAEYQRLGLTHLWYAEMMNQIMASGKGLIQAEEIQYRPAVMKGNIEFGCITVDPAISEKTWANESAVCVHGFVDGAWQLVAFEKQVGLDPIELIHLVIALMHEWNIWIVGFESNQYQAALVKLFPYECIRVGVNAIAVPVLSSKSKTARIYAWAGLIKAGEYYLTEGEIAATTQLLEYDPAMKENVDDLIDAAASIVHMTNYYMLDILEARRELPAISGPQQQTSIDVSRF